MSRYYYKASSDLPFGIAIFLIGLIFAAVVGWIANIVKIVGVISDPITGMFILRVVGIFVAPLGAVLGYV